MTHVPMCLACREKEVTAEFTYSDGEGFCSYECWESCEEPAEDRFASETEAESHGVYDFDYDGKWARLNEV